jgi:hypothetical protein
MLLAATQPQRVKLNPGLYHLFVEVANFFNGWGIMTEIGD